MTQPALPGLPVEPETSIDQRHTLERLIFEETLEKHNIPWRDEYAVLIEAGWVWRKAVVIIWLGLPRDQRVPETKQELAQLLGMTTTKTIVKYERDPAVQAQVMARAAASLMQHAAEVDAALIKSATDPDYKNNQDRKTYYQLTGRLREVHDVNVAQKPDEAAVRQMSEAELLALAANGNEEGGNDAGDSD